MELRSHKLQGEPPAPHHPKKRFSGSGQGVRFCISKKHPGDAHTAGPETSLGVGHKVHGTGIMPVLFRVEFLARGT